MKRLLRIGVGCVALAGCGPKSDRDYPAADNMSAGAAPTAMDARAPGIDVTAAPGVAFSYRDGFRLPSDRIAAVQEAHAKACEQLGVARCRITGMRYRLLGENNIEGDLTFKLTPALARGFTKEGTGVVERAGGTLVDAEITGTDTQPITARADTEHVSAAAEMSRIDATLVHTRSAAERVQLQQQRADDATRAAAATDTADRCARQPCLDTGHFRLRIRSRRTRLRHLGTFHQRDQHGHRVGRDDAGGRARTARNLRPTGAGRRAGDLGDRHASPPPAREAGDVVHRLIARTPGPIAPRLPAPASPPRRGFRLQGT